MSFLDPFGFWESDIKSKALPSISKSQQKLIDQISKYLEPFIGKEAEAYPGQLTADIPDLFTKAYEEYEAGFGADESRQAIQDLISGKPSYTFDPEATTERWRETYAGPVMQAYEDIALPMYKEGFNLPGVLYSRGRGEGVAREVSRFYGEHVAPTLYSSLQTGERMGFESAEAAAGRRMPALGLPAQQFGQAASVADALRQMKQQALSMDYQEWLRTRAEPGWAVQTAMGFMTQPTMDYAAFREPSMIEQLSGLASGAGALMEGMAA